MTGVVAYALSPGVIIVEFKTGRQYAYTDETAGEDDVLEMQRLAQAGEGLAGFISMNDPGFERIR